MGYQSIYWSIFISVVGINSCKFFNIHINCKVFLTKFYMNIVLSNEVNYFNFFTHRIKYYLLKLLFSLIYIAYENYFYMHIYIH